MDNILLSICIPTYNRYTKLKSMLIQLVTCERRDFEVIVQDNCSTDGTKNIINEISDSRIRLIENSENIGSFKNGIGAFFEAHGKYCMICLDKDCILGKNLSCFMEVLDTLSDINYGICELNTTAKNGYELFTSQQDCLNFFTYRGFHPSGMFWKTELYRNCSVIPGILKSNFSFAFFPDLVMAECISKEENGLYYRNPLIITETSVQSAKRKTLTYGISQIFFFPKNRIFEYKVYLGQLETLRLEKKMQLWIKVFIRGLIASTFGFRSVMQDSLHLEHYRIQPRNVRFVELIGIAFRYTLCILFSSRKKAFNKLFE